MRVRLGSGTTATDGSSGASGSFGPPVAVDDPRPLAYDPPAFRVVAAPGLSGTSIPDQSFLKPSPRKEGLIPMRLGRRVARFLFWGLVLCFSSLAGGLWFAYWYITDSETISRIIREHAVRYSQSILDPGRVGPASSPASSYFTTSNCGRRSTERFRDAPNSLSFASGQPEKTGQRPLRPSKIVIGTPTLRLRKEKRNLEHSGHSCGSLARAMDRTPALSRSRTAPSSSIPAKNPPQLPSRPSSPATASLETSAAAPPPTSPGAEPLASSARPVSDHSPAILRDVTLNIDPAVKAPTTSASMEPHSGDGFRAVDALRFDRFEYRQHRVER